MRWWAVGQGSKVFPPQIAGEAAPGREADYRGVGPLCMQGAGRCPLSHLHPHRQLESENQLEMASCRLTMENTLNMGAFGWLSVMTG